MPAHEFLLSRGAPARLADHVPRGTGHGPEREGSRRRRQGRVRGAAQVSPSSGVSSPLASWISADAWGESAAGGMTSSVSAAFSQRGN